MVDDKRETDLWIMNKDGSTNRFFLKGSSGKWSPDGSKIAFTNKGESEGINGTQIFVKYLGVEGEPTQITKLEKSPSSLEWSPDGNYIAFFDDPHNAPPNFFKKMNGFDSHVAVQVKSREDLILVKDRLDHVGWSSFEIDHEFVISLYIFDPNGIQLEFTCRADDHDQIMEKDSKKAHKELSLWTKKTRGIKLNELIGKKISIGSVKIEVLDLCRPCRHLSEKLGRNDIIKEFLRKGGVRCQIMKDGKISLNNKIKIIQPSNQ